MKTPAALGLILFAAMPAAAANRAKVSPEQIAAAINEADVSMVPYREGNVMSEDIRSVRCIGSDEEPTEFECAWRQRTKHGWAKRTNWLAIDKTGWHVIG
jgi:hypothetical protein